MPATSTAARVGAAMAMKRIVVGVDGTAPSRAALEWAAGEAHRHGDYVVAVLAVDGEPAQELSDVVEDVLGRIPSVEVELRVVRDRPAAALIDAARGAQLLVVGSGELDRSVVSECAQSAPCPVVVVPPPMHVAA